MSAMFSPTMLEKLGTVEKILAATMVALPHNPEGARITREQAIAKYGYPDQRKLAIEFMNLLLDGMPIQAEIAPALENATGEYDETARHFMAAVGIGRLRQMHGNGDTRMGRGYRYGENLILSLWGVQPMHDDRIDRALEWAYK